MNNENNTALLSSVVNYIQQPTKRAKGKRKHILKIIHYEYHGYFITQIRYTLSWTHKTRYENVNIFNSSEYNWLVNSYNNRDTLARGAEVEYIEVDEKTKNPVKRKKEEPIRIADEIYIDLPESHYTIDPDDKEYFRMRNVVYNPADFGNLHESHIGHFNASVSWTQNPGRPGLYINSIDTTARFDADSILMFIHAKELKELLYNDIVNINIGDPKKKKDYVRIFVERLFNHTMMLYYINWCDPDWDLTEITYQKAWNLAMYILAQLKPFTKEFDWLPGVKISYVRWMFERKMKNELDKGLKHYFLKLAHSKLVTKETRYRFPFYYSELDKIAFKEQFPKPKTDHQINIENRNQQIINDHNQGLSIRKLAVKYSLSVGCIHKIISIP